MRDAVAKQSTHFASDGPDSDADVLDRIKAREPVEPTVFVKVLQYGLFAESLDGQDSLLAQLADKFVGTLDATSRIAIEPEDDLDHLVEQLGNDNENYDFVMGLFDTVSRRLKKIDFIPIPGWHIDLSALYFRPLAERASPVPVLWQDFLNNKESGKYLAVVIQGEAGQIFLRGTHRFPKDLVKSDGYTRSFEELALRFSKTAETHPGLTAVFVADEYTVLQVMRFLNSGIRETQRGSSAVLLDNTEGMPIPSYALSLAFHEAKPASKRLIARALVDEIFANDCRATATLYADVSFNGFVDLPPGVDDELSVWAPRFFDLTTKEATIYFWKTFVARFNDLAKARHADLRGKTAYKKYLEGVEKHLSKNIT